MPLLSRAKRKVANAGKVTLRMDPMRRHALIREHWPTSGCRSRRIPNVFHITRPEGTSPSRSASGPSSRTSKSPAGWKVAVVQFKDVERNMLVLREAFGVRVEFTGSRADGWE